MMMNLTACYTILGLDPLADAAQARQQYKKLVRRWHPDPFPQGSAAKAEAEERLKQINIAYARIKAHLAAHPDPAPRADAGPAPPTAPPCAAKPSSAEDTHPRRSWIDHLFESLNAFAGGGNALVHADSADNHQNNRKRSFQQVLDEMAGNAEANPGTPSHRAGHHRRAAASHGRRGSSGVDSIGGTARVEPIKPVGRVRGIGK